MNKFTDIHLFSNPWKKHVLFYELWYKWLTYEKFLLLEIFQVYIYHSKEFFNREVKIKRAGIKNSLKQIARGILKLSEKVRADIIGSTRSIKGNLSHHQRQNTHIAKITQCKYYFIKYAVYLDRLCE